MFNPRAAVGNGSRLSCHNIPKKIAAAPFQCSVWLRNGVKTLNVRVRQLRRSETGCTTSGGRWYCTDRSGAKIRSRERVRVRKQKKHIIDVLFKKKSARRDSNPRPRPWQGRAPPTEPLAHKKCYSQAHGYYTIWKRICQQKKGKKLKKIQIVYAIETI